MLTDCFKCWSTPCICGWDWRQRTIDQLKKQLIQLTRAIEFKEDHPDAQFSGFLEDNKDTEDDKAFMEFIRRG